MSGEPKCDDAQICYFDAGKVFNICASEQRIAVDCLRTLLCVFVPNCMLLLGMTDDWPIIVFICRLSWQTFVSHPCPCTEDQCKKRFIKINQSSMFVFHNLSTLCCIDVVDKPQQNEWATKCLICDQFACNCWAGLMRRTLGQEAGGVLTENSLHLPVAEQNIITRNYNMLLLVWKNKSSFCSVDGIVVIIVLRKHAVVKLANQA